jgi:hypothetical protein
VAWVIAAPTGKRGGNLGGFRQLRIAGPSNGLSGVQFDAVRALSGQPDPHVIALFRLGPGTRAVIKAR